MTLENTGDEPMNEITIEVSKSPEIYRQYRKYIPILDAHQKVEININDLKDENNNPLQFSTSLCDYICHVRDSKELYGFSFTI
jgi:hypothetical protein